MSEIRILLPEKIFILKNIKKQGIVYDNEEYSIYFKNILMPYSDNYDIQINCRYGKNIGYCWRLDCFDNVDDIFDLTLSVYDENGELLAEKECKIELLEKKANKRINLLCIGDSMTRSEIYIKQAVEKSRDINTIGLRNICHDVYHEGRGGWTSYNYCKVAEDSGAGVSPFLFPKGYTGKEYYGSSKFWKKIKDAEYNTNYHYAGIEYQSIEEGMVCCEDGKLYRYSDGEYKLEEENPEFEFNFGKYIERYNMPIPDVVSLLFGANEFQTCKYSKLNEEIEKYISTLRYMVGNIKNFDSSIKIIINMPVCGGGQYAWGMQLGCAGTAKQYAFNIKKACYAILKEFDNKISENIFVCPMLAVCDTESGFPWDVKKVNIYSDMTKTECTNWVHPSEVGYKQMGDALAAVITAARNIK